MEIERRKYKMISDPEIARYTMPAWFVDRMMTDDWCFALLTTSGHTIYISRINAISENGDWIDVSLLHEIPDEAEKFDNKNIVLAVNGNRTNASISMYQIIAAYEVATT